jgi:lipopolysaccharide biosynthesis regulator YciM
MFELSMWYYIVGLAIILLFAGLLTVQMRRKKRREARDGGLYISALQAILAGNQVDAFYKLKEVVSQDSSNIDAYLRLGKILADRGKAKQAIQIHSDLLLRADLTPAQKTEINHFLIEDYVMDGQIDHAIDLLRKEFDGDASRLDTGARLVDLLMEGGKFEEAETIAEKLNKRDSDRFAAQLATVKIMLADRFRDEGKGKRARILYKAAHHLDNEKHDVWVKIGDSYLDEDRTEDAVKAWITLTEESPQSAHLVFDRLRRSLFDLGQFNTINSIFEGILERDQNNVSALLALGELYHKKGDHMQALEYYRQALALKPELTAANLGIARIYRDQGRIDDAFDILEKQFFQTEAMRQES